ncbi:MAG: hypothetical protein IT324_12805 [Anaerolineae bacterium]|nr:hypothetical protein [Anaerolineae bacterium]
MSITVHWHDATRQVIYFQFSSTWTWKEFYEAVNQSYEMVDKVGHPVAAFIDTRSSSILPDNFLSGIKNIDMKTHPRIERIVMIGANPFMIKLIDMFNRLRPHKSPTKRLNFAVSYDHAYTLLYDQQGERV